MSAAQHLTGESMLGTRIKGEWRVLKKMETQPAHTGGLFSTGYVVKHENGREAFMKVTDCSLMCTDTGDMLAAMLATANSYETEKKILEYCRGNNMDRVVTPLDYGDKMHVYAGIKEPIFWIIFELAKADARQQISSVKAFDFNWAVHAMHNLCVATKQLHTANVSHNDIKPSNFLIFGKLLQKLGDLGSATSPKFPSLHDTKFCVGDRRYAAPENLYVNESSFGKPLFEQRKASDLYCLGSMAMFLLSMPMVTTYLLNQLDPMHRPITEDGAGWTGDFSGVLPYWNAAFSKMLAEISDSLPKNERGELSEAGELYLSVIKQLCNPNPTLRGHPDNRFANRDSYGLEKYISAFDRLRVTGMVAANAK